MQPRFHGKFLIIPISIFGLTGCAEFDLRKGPDPVMNGVAVQDASRNKSMVMAALVEDARRPDGRVYYYEVAEAGFNFVDDQCRSYFNALFFLDRRRDELKSGLATGAATTAAILMATGASQLSLGVVAAAFGLASNATDIVAGTYLYRLPPATTQGFVQKLQSAFRDGAAANRANIDSPASAYYLVQRYLNLCLPPTIEAEITQQISATSAFGVSTGGGSLFSVETVSNPPPRRPPLIGPPPLTRQEVSAVRITTPKGTITNKPRPPGQVEKAIKSFAFQVQAALCVPKADINGTLNDATVKVIGDYLRAIGRPVPEKIDLLTLQPVLAKAVENVPNCAAAGFEDPYEVAKFGIPSNWTSHKITTLQTNILNFLRENGSIISVEPTGMFDAQTRKAIGEARKIAVGKNLLPSNEEGDQIDDRFNLLFH